MRTLWNEKRPPLGGSRFGGRPGEVAGLREQDDGEADERAGQSGDLGVAHGVVEVEFGIDAHELDSKPTYT